MDFIIYGVLCNIYFIFKIGHVNTHRSSSLQLLHSNTWFKDITLCLSIPLWWEQLNTNWQCWIVYSCTCLLVHIGKTISKTDTFKWDCQIVGMILTLLMTHTSFAHSPHSMSQNILTAVPLKEACKVTSSYHHQCYHLGPIFLYWLYTAKTSNWPQYIYPPPTGYPLHTTSKVLLNLIKILSLSCWKPSKDSTQSKRQRPHKDLQVADTIKRVFVSCLFCFFFVLFRQRFSLHSHLYSWEC